MATDSSGFNTSSAFTQKDYDPTNSALLNGLQSAATYDPSTQSTSTPTSVANYLRPLQSQNTSYQDTASTTQNLQSTSGYGNRSGPAQTNDASFYGLTAASNNTLNAGYAQSMSGAGQSKLAVAANANRATGSAPTTATGQTTTGVASTSAVAPNANQGSVANSGATAYSGPSVVKVYQGGDAYGVYKFNPSSGSYVMLGQITGHTPASQLSSILAQVGYNSLASVPTQALSGSVNTAMGTDMGVSSLNNANAAAIAAYQKGNEQAAATQTATLASGSQAAIQQQALDYMTMHGGQLSPQMQAVLSNSYTGNAAVMQAQQAGIQAAQQAYATQQAHAAALSGLQMGAIDTSASDASDRANQASLASQLASQGGGASGGVADRSGAFQAATLAGQGLLNHDTAAAKSYDSNLSNFANALSAQNTYDTQATGNQLYSDIQGVQQIATQLQQEMGQLGTKASNQAQAQLDNLHNALSAYQQAVNDYGQNSQQAMAVAKGILSSAASVAAVV